MTELKTTTNFWSDGSGRLVSSAKITNLLPGEIFVFGSNSAGFHGGGAARLAFNNFGASWGQGSGLQGQSYAIDTMNSFEKMSGEVARFLTFAKDNSEDTFLVTEIGCGIAGYSPEDVAPLFIGSSSNLALPTSFLAILG